VPLNVFVAEHAVGVDTLYDPDKVVEVGVKFPKGVRLETVGFRPMGTALMPSHNTFETFEVPSVRYVKSVWLVLNDANPT